MAEKVVRIRIDDLSGDEIPDGTGERVEFAVRGKSYVLDLSDSNLAKFDKAIAPYVEAAATVKSGRGGSRTAGTRNYSSPLDGRSKEEKQAIRQWARESGYEVSDRGRIAVEIVDAYDKLH